MADEYGQASAPEEAPEAAEVGTPAEAPAQSDPPVAQAQETPEVTPTFTPPAPAPEEAPRGASDVDPTVGSNDPSTDSPDATTDEPVTVDNEFGGPDEETAGEPVPRAPIPERTPIVTTVPVEARNGDQSGFSIAERVSQEVIEAAHATKRAVEEAAEALNEQVNTAREAYAKRFALTDQGQQHKQHDAAEAAMRDVSPATQEGHDWMDIDSNAPMRVV